MTDQGGVPNWVVAILKWMLMLGVLGGIVYIAVPQALELLSGAVQFGTEDDGVDELEEIDGPALDEPTEEPEPVTGTVHIVDQLASRSGATSHTGPEQIELGLGAEYAEELYLAFEPIPVDYPCLTSVILRVLTTDSDPTQISAQPSQLTALNSFTEGDPLPADSLIVGGGEATATLDGNPGLLAWDVTEQYRVAATSVGEDDPVVLALLPEDAEDVADPEEEFRSVLNAMDVGEEQLARLEWSATPTCPDGSAPETDDDEADGPSFEGDDLEDGADDGEEGGDGDEHDDGEGEDTGEEPDDGEDGAEADGVAQT